MNKKGLALLAFSIGCVFFLTGCNAIGNALNPFQETPPPEAYLGEKNDHALQSGTNSAQKARGVLEGVARYPRAHQPQPVNPVIKPSVVRLMWVPDHLNPNGDLVPSHYYYLKVLDDTWAVTDVFDQEKQIGGGSFGNPSLIPFTKTN